MEGDGRARIRFRWRRKKGEVKWKRKNGSLRREKSRARLWHGASKAVEGIVTRPDRPLHVTFKHSGVAFFFMPPLPSVSGRLLERPGTVGVLTVHVVYMHYHAIQSAVKCRRRS